MGVRLCVIGSSPAWPNPGSAQSGYLVEGPGRLLLDCGPGVLGRLRANGKLEVDAIAITHFHLDHWGDLVPWSWLCAYGTDTMNHPELWLPPGGEEQLARFASLWGNTGMFDRAFELREYAPDSAFTTAGFEVEARRVLHFDLEAYGFRVRGPDGTLLAYSGDAGPSDELDSLARGADLFLCEATLEELNREGAPRGHLSASEALAAADGPVLLTHRPCELSTPEAALATDGLVLKIERKA
jgi:ribonuclease BN (tRNA processing enzyme)